ncbi:hypothetical protein AHAS_Ahas06G0047100 [Arachis hypogaea]
MWANAYLCEKFCAGIRTTSRCEDINSSLKKFIKSENCLLEFVENLDQVVKDYQNNEFIADYKTLYSNPVLTTALETLERSVSKFYTRKIFYEVQKQIEGVGALLVLHRDSIGSTEKFMFRKYQKPHHVYSVFVDRSCDKYECSCGAKMPRSPIVVVSMPQSIPRINFVLDTVHCEVPAYRCVLQPRNARNHTTLP